MELLDLYDSDRRPTGQTVARGSKLPEGAYRLVVHACIFNKEGQMLIQQRTAFKKFWPSLWDVSMGGGVSAGESSRQGAQRELWEELGIDHDFSNERPFITIAFDEDRDGGFDDYYAFEWNGDLASLRLQPSEVQAAKWATKEEVLGMLADGTFVSYYPGMIEAIFDLWNTHSAFRE